MNPGDEEDSKIKELISVQRDRTDKVDGQVQIDEEGNGESDRDPRCQSQTAAPVEEQ